MTVPPEVPTAKTVLVPLISLPAEAAQAALGGVLAGMGTFVGSLTVTNASNPQALKAAGIGAGFVAVSFFANSMKNWFQQKYGTAV